jgi:hypothetical protein
VFLGSEGGYELMSENYHHTKIAFKSSLAQHLIGWWVGGCGSIGQVTSLAQTWNSIHIDFDGAICGTLPSTCSLKGRSIHPTQYQAFS